HAEIVRYPGRHEMGRACARAAHGRGAEEAWSRGRHRAAAKIRSSAMKVELPEILIQEVAPRDGLQIEPVWVATDEKVRLVDALSALGFRRIEVSSFVSAKAVPALRDAAEVFASIARRPGAIYTALVPNQRGAELALAAHADELNFVMSASETHNLANMNMTHDRSLASLSEIVKPVHEMRALVNATVATAFGCPFEGKQRPDKVLDIVKRYLDLGADGVTLADTTGMANPAQVSQ